MPDYLSRHSPMKTNDINKMNEKNLHFAENMALNSIKDARFI